MDTSEVNLKIEENDSRDEKEARQKSINRLLNYAETLDW